jgi:hypothetical protein
MSDRGIPRRDVLAAVSAAGAVATLPTTVVAEPPEEEFRYKCTKELANGTVRTMEVSEATGRALNRDDSNGWVCG